VAAQMLLAEASGDATTRHEHRSVVLQPELVVRTSSMHRVG